MNKNSDNPQDSISYINPHAHAESVREVAMPVADNIIAYENGERLVPEGKRTREEARAVELGKAVGQGSLKDSIETSVRDPLARHEGLEALLDSSGPRRTTREQLHAAAVVLVAVLRAVPLNAVSASRKTFNKRAKPLFIIGDTAVLADQVYRAGTPIWLALPLGLSLATAVVAIGTQCGHEIATARQRRKRGKPAPDAPAAVVPLYDDGSGDESFTLWLQFAMAAAAAIFLALLFTGIGAGDSAKTAMGFGLLGALTVVGSIGSEAYATNDAAEQLEAAEATMAKDSQELKAFDSLEQESASARSVATTSEAAGRHGAAAALATATSTANRLPDTPEVGGYIDSGNIPAIEAPPAPGGRESLIPKARRTRTRAAFVLTGGLIPGSTADRTDVGDDGDGEGASDNHQAPSRHRPFSGTWRQPGKAEANGGPEGSST